MQDFTDALYTAAALVVHFDAELREIARWNDAGIDIARAPEADCSPPWA